ncbi:MAG: type IV pili twitching motility protein PilT, partial [Ectothiorhodospira sp.]
TFDQALFHLYEAGEITYEDALRHADSVNDLRLRIKLDSQRGEESGLMDDADGLKMEETPEESGMRG